MIIYKSFHNIDVSLGTLTRKNMPEDFDAFVKSYIRFAISNGNNKEYNVTDSNCTVVHCISSISTIAINNPELSEEDLLELDGFSNSIATKLLSEEQQAQKRIAAMGKQIKMGSLIQALVKSNYTDILDSDDLNRAFDNDKAINYVTRTILFASSITSIIWIIFLFVLYLLAW